MLVVSAMLLVPVYCGVGAILLWCCWCHSTVVLLVPFYCGVDAAVWYCYYKINRPPLFRVTMSMTF